MDDVLASKLIARIVQRDDAALAQLWRGLDRAVSAYLRSVLSREHEQDEVKSETIEIIWRTADQFDFRSRVKTWVIGIARNRALMKLRSRRDHEELEDCMEESATSHDSLLEMLDGSQVRQHVRNCISKLDAKYREAIQLLFFQEFSINEISVLVGVPDGTVKSRVFNAKVGIKTCLQRRLKGRGDLTSDRQNER